MTEKESNEYTHRDENEKDRMCIRTKLRKNISDFPHSLLRISTNNEIQKYNNISCKIIKTSCDKLPLNSPNSFNRCFSIRDYSNRNQFSLNTDKRYLSTNPSTTKSMIAYKKKIVLPDNTNKTARFNRMEKELYSENNTNNVMEFSIGNNTVNEQKGFKDLLDKSTHLMKNKSLQNLQRKIENIPSVNSLHKVSYDFDFFNNMKIMNLTEDNRYLKNELEVMRKRNVELEAKVTNCKTEISYKKKEISELTQELNKSKLLETVTNENNNYNCISDVMTGSNTFTNTLQSRNDTNKAINYKENINNINNKLYDTLRNELEKKEEENRELRKIIIEISKERDIYKNNLELLDNKLREFENNYRKIEEDYEKYKENQGLLDKKMRNLEVENNTLRDERNIYLGKYMKKKREVSIIRESYQQLEVKMINMENRSNLSKINRKSKNKSCGSIKNYGAFSTTKSKNMAQSCTNLCSESNNERMSENNENIPENNENNRENKRNIYNKIHSLKIDLNNTNKANHINNNIININEETNIKTHKKYYVNLNTQKTLNKINGNEFTFGDLYRKIKNIKKNI